MCGLDPSHLPEDLQGFRIGADAVVWYEEEIDRFRGIVAKLRQQSGEAEDEEDRIKWRAFSQCIAERNPSTHEMPSVEGQEQTR